MSPVLRSRRIFREISLFLEEFPREAQNKHWPIRRFGHESLQVGSRGKTRYGVWGTWSSRSIDVIESNRVNIWREPVPTYAISVVIGSGGFGEFGECKKRFLRFLFSARVFTFLNIFLIFPTFLFLKTFIENTIWNHYHCTRGKIPNIWNGDLDGLLNASRGFVSDSWAACLSRVSTHSAILLLQVCLSVCLPVCHSVS